MTAIIDHQKQNLEEMNKCLSSYPYFRIFYPTVTGTWQIPPTTARDNIHAELSEEEKARQAEWERTATPEEKAEMSRYKEKLLKTLAKARQDNGFKTDTERSRAEEAE